MHHLEELVEIVAENRSKNSDIFDKISLKKNQKNADVRFFQAIRKRKLLTDEAASRHFFKEEPGKRFRKFKYQVSQKLLRSIFFINPNRAGLSVYSKALLWCSLMRHCIYVVSFFSGRLTADELCKKMLKKALENQLSEYIIFSTVILLEHNAFAGEKDYYRYDKIYVEWLAVYNLEQEAKRYIREIKMKFAGKTAIEPADAGPIYAYTETLKTRMGSHPPFMLQICYYRLLGFAHQIGLRYSECLDTWAETERYLVLLCYIIFVDYQKISYI